MENFIGGLLTQKTARWIVARHRAAGQAPDGLPPRTTTAFQHTLCAPPTKWFDLPLGLVSARLTVSAQKGFYRAGGRGQHPPTMSRPARKLKNLEEKIASKTARKRAGKKTKRWKKAAEAYRPLTQ